MLAVGILESDVNSEVVSLQRLHFRSPLSPCSPPAPSGDVLEGLTTTQLPAGRAPVCKSTLLSRTSNRNARLNRSAFPKPVCNRRLPAQSNSRERAPLPCVLLWLEPSHAFVFVWRGRVRGVSVAMKSVHLCVWSLSLPKFTQHNRKNT